MKFHPWVFSVLFLIYLTAFPNWYCKASGKTASCREDSIFVEWLDDSQDTCQPQNNGSLPYRLARNVSREETQDKRLGAHLWPCHKNLMHSLPMFFVLFHFFLSISLLPCHLCFGWNYLAVVFPEVITYGRGGHRSTTLKNGLAVGMVRGQDSWTATALMINVLLLWC